MKTYLKIEYKTKTAYESSDGKTWTPLKTNFTQWVDLCIRSTYENWEVLKKNAGVGVFKTEKRPYIPPKYIISEDVFKTKAKKQARLRELRSTMATV